MTRFLIYLFPAMIDTVLGTVLFVAAVRTAEAGGAASRVTALVTVWGLTCMGGCQVAGRLVTPKNAAWMTVAASVAMAGCMYALILVPDLAAQYVVMAVIGVATAFFFGPFQIFMKAVERDRPHGVARCTGLYTFSWSAGIACGPFMAGYVWMVAGWQACYVVGAALALLAALGIVFLRYHAAETPGSAGPEVDATVATDGEKGEPLDLAWLGWIAAGIGCLAMHVARSLFPASAVAIGISRTEQGTTLALMSAVQALVGLVLCRSRTWMYRAVPVVLFGLFGLAGLILFGLADRAVLFYAGAVCFGVYSGSFFFYLVFHALVHPTRSARYVLINESIVGFTAIVGPLAGGLIADLVAMRAPYLFAAGLVAGALILQTCVHRSSRY